MLRSLVNKTNRGVIESLDCDKINVRLNKLLCEWTELKHKINLLVK